MFVEGAVQLGVKSIIRKECFMMIVDFTSALALVSIIPLVFVPPACLAAVLGVLL